MLKHTLCFPHFGFQFIFWWYDSFECWFFTLRSLEHFITITPAVQKRVLFGSWASCTCLGSRVRVQEGATGVERGQASSSLDSSTVLESRVIPNFEIKLFMFVKQTKQKICSGEHVLHCVDVTADHVESSDQTCTLLFYRVTIGARIFCILYKFLQHTYIYIYDPFWKLSFLFCLFCLFHYFFLLPALFFVEFELILRYWDVYDSPPFNCGNILFWQIRNFFSLRNKKISLCMKPLICLCIY